MNQPSSPAAELSTETAAMHALLQVLEREQACLCAGDAEGCAALLDDKARQVSVLVARAADRHRRLAALGFSADEAGMSDWLHNAADTDVAQWASLMAVTGDAHERNRVNGLLLSQLAARNRQALDALNLRSSGTGLYGPGGQTDYAAPRATRIIG